MYKQLPPAVRDSVLVARSSVAGEVVFIAGLGYCVWHILQTSLDEWYLRNPKVDASTQVLLKKLATYTIVVLSTIPALHIMGINVGGALAFGGVGGLAVGLAAKDLASNFVSGLAVFLTQPFKIGDEIEFVHDRHKVQGTVTDIGLYKTKIRCPDSAPMSVPNAQFIHGKGKSYGHVRVVMYVMYVHVAIGCVSCSSYDL